MRRYPYEGVCLTRAGYLFTLRCPWVLEAPSLRFAINLGSYPRPEFSRKFQKMRYPEEGPIASLQHSRGMDVQELPVSKAYDGPHFCSVVVTRV